MEHLRQEFPGGRTTISAERLEQASVPSQAFVEEELSPQQNLFAG
jgi:hypothetical protein